MSRFFCNLLNKSRFRCTIEFSFLSYEADNFYFCHYLVLSYKSKQHIPLSLACYKFTLFNKVILRIYFYLQVYLQHFHAQHCRNLVTSEMLVICPLH